MYILRLGRGAIQRRVKRGLSMCYVPYVFPSLPTLSPFTTEVGWTFSPQDQHLDVLF